MLPATSQPDHTAPLAAAVPVQPFLAAVAPILPGRDREMRTGLVGYPASCVCVCVHRRDFVGGRTSLKLFKMTLKISVNCAIIFNDTHRSAVQNPCAVSCTFAWPSSSLVSSSLPLWPQSNCKTAGQQSQHVHVLQVDIKLLHFLHSFLTVWQ